MQWQGLEERFWSNVNKSHGLGPNGDCWEWTGTPCYGYGVIRAFGKKRKAHRVAWLLAIGKWPEPFACHTCDNRLCVRFEHLYEGDHKSNVQDKVDRDRQTRGSQHPFAKLVESDIQVICESTLSERRLAALLGVSHTVVGEIRRGRAWSHV